MQRAHVGVVVKLPIFHYVIPGLIPSEDVGQLDDIIRELEKNIPTSLSSTLSHDVNPEFIFLVHEAQDDLKNCRNLSQVLRRAQIVLDGIWEHLNTGHWSKVSATERQVYTAAGLLKTNLPQPAQRVDEARRDWDETGQSREPPSTHTHAFHTPHHENPCLKNSCLSGHGIELRTSEIGGQSRCKCKLKVCIQVCSNCKLHNGAGKQSATIGTATSRHAFWRRVGKFGNFSSFSLRITALLWDFTKKRKLSKWPVCYQRECSLDLLDTDKQNISTILEVFDKHFTPAKNVIYERWVFDTAHQESGESVEQFICRAQALTAISEYGALAAEMFRNNIVVGVADHRLRRQLLSECFGAVGLEIQALLQIKLHEADGDKQLSDQDVYKKALETADMSLLLGAPLSVMDGESMIKCAHILTSVVSTSNIAAENVGATSSTVWMSVEQIPGVRGKHVPILKQPSLERFQVEHFKTQYPVKLTGQLMCDALRSYDAHSTLPHLNALRKSFTVLEEAGHVPTGYSLAMIRIL
ncbi:hypothetical protein PR048_028992 [Dryococelus australis]|uniref:Uncharacterized protein n=1 Tax=Dryococelus australis TaxID=614101 RepID=A0ABQ9GEM5_9NEOP|nr:hypothetical protein PR048_028992 [Dryococelus australis]